MFDLTGQAVLVTGASGGIGGAIARALHRHGATVALAGTRTADAARGAGHQYRLPCQVEHAGRVFEFIESVPFRPSSPGLTRGSTDFFVDGRAKPGHDGLGRMRMELRIAVLSC